ncbi:uridylate kinase [Methylobacterium sp. E-066]|uniref:uridylate kinase n=1 Tax=Methylobacterium sp. E-066 TaxID=2836584 RepID=UPI001FBB049A|nr:uridylate kinase [Methylobacterium sp. E-066]MCJ2144546.1 uridylate kinase [Methylobacterium sp. E-066]
MRGRAIDAIVRLILDLRPSHPLRIAIDGRTSSGKTTLADEIATETRDHGRSVIRTSIDGFHRPKAERYSRGRRSAEGYYYDARDLTAIKDLLLRPLGPQGDLLYRTASFDLELDRPIDAPRHKAEAGNILIVDGTFLQRPELRAEWDLIIFVDVPVELARARGADRDAERLGGPEESQAIYRERYLPAFAIYETYCDPKTGAHIVFENANFESAKAHIQRLPELS